MAFLASRFEFLKLNIPEGMSGPKFEMAPSAYTIMYSFDSSGFTNTRQDQAMLPNIIDENEYEIIQIDAS